MFFGLPWMLLGLVGLPTLAAIYWLRSRAKPRTVSSLFLWSDQRKPRQGGRIFQRLQTPITFFLELIALACLAMAAAAPALIQHQQSRPLILVLDDSYSMQGGTKSNARERALDRVLKELQRTTYVARIVLAGTRPRVLGNIIRTPVEFREAAEEWTCTAPTAHLESAIVLASELGGATARVLVITDHSPPFSVPPRNVQWWAVGHPENNLAITAASRDSSQNSAGDLQDRVLLEVSNLGTVPARTELALKNNGQDAGTKQPLDLAAGEARRLIFNLSTTTDLQAELGPDPLLIDNRALLISPRQRPLRVQLDVAESDSPGSLSAALRRALTASGQVLLVDSRPELLIVDHSIPETSESQVLQFLTGSEPASFDGPFVVDRSHFLTEGLSLDALVWTAPAQSTPAGTPVILAGNRVLLADEETVAGRHHLQMALEPALSSLIDSPDWPILLTNLIRWCLANRPGPAESNLHLGQTLRITLTDLAASEANATLIWPNATEHSIPIHGRQLEVVLEQVGRYQFRCGDMDFPLACSALQAEESNLARCATGEWGQWEDSGEFQDRRLALDWAFIIVALGCLITELALLARGGVSGT